ncbi:unnamed protein product, partial [Chrysoparadoxa australica]
VKGEVADSPTQQEGREGPVAMISLRILAFSAFMAYAASFMSSTPFHGAVSSTPWQMQQKEVTDTKPKWAGGGLVSELVNALISYKPLYGLLKVEARKVLIKTAEEKGVNWTRESDRLLQMREKLEQLKEATEDKGLVYPDYYRVPFHAYEEGNLNWQAAAEAESATYAMALRIWPKEGLESDVAQQRLRDSYIDAIKEYRAERQNTEALQILEVGCSVGLSTKYLADSFPEAKVLGMDLSPHFLAVAQQLEEERGEKGRITWMHERFETSGLREASFDLITVPFVFHEMPQATIRDCLREVHRLLKKGGMLCVTEIDPASPVIQGLPAPIFTMMKSTEPHADEQYYSLDLVEAMEAAGLRHVKKVISDPRHSTWLSSKPQ